MTLVEILLLIIALPTIFALLIGLLSFVGSLFENARARRQQRAWERRHEAWEAWCRLRAEEERRPKEEWSERRLVVGLAAAIPLLLLLVATGVWGR